MPIRHPTPSSNIRHNLGVYRLNGFTGRNEELLRLRAWLTDDSGQAALAISGNQGNGKSTLATAAAWNAIHHFPDGIIWVGAAGSDSFRLYDIVRTLDTVLGTTLTRISQERWGIGILEQLYRRRRLLILDELSGALDDEVRTLVDIIGHLSESGGRSRILLIDRDIAPEIQKLVGERHLLLGGLSLAETVEFVRVRAPQAVQDTALRHVEELHARTGGRPLSVRLVMGLLLEYGVWSELNSALGELPVYNGSLSMPEMTAFAVENFAAFWPHAGPLLDRLVSAAGGASFTALSELFWGDLGEQAEFQETVQALIQRALVEENNFTQRILVQPVVRRYLAQGAVMLGEEWNRSHAAYYLHYARRYQEIPLQRWSEIDPEWGNIHLGADWLSTRIERIWRRPALALVREPLEREGLPDIVMDSPDVRGDLVQMREYALCLAHYAFWRHPPGILRWLAAGAVASFALDDIRDFGWLLTNIGRQLFFSGEVEAAIEWLERALHIFDEKDMLMEMAYVHTDLGTSLRVLDEARPALDQLWLAFEAVAQLGDQHSLATAYINLGSAYFSMNNYEKAVEQQRKALRISLRLQSAHLSASAHNNMGLALEGMERFEDAHRAYQNALIVFQQMADEAGISTCYNNLGSVAYARQDFGEALQWYEKDLELSERRGAWMDRAATLHNLGHVALEQKNYAQARNYFERSQELYAAFQLTDYVAEEQEMLEYVASLAEEKDQ
ncbi:MAG: tetratricopeptide repeat protein [Caldilineaceae bacterium]